MQALVNDLDGLELMGILSGRSLINVPVCIERSSGPGHELREQISRKDPHSTHPDKRRTSTFDPLG